MGKTKYFLIFIFFILSAFLALSCKDSDSKIKTVTPVPSGEYAIIDKPYIFNLNVVSLVDYKIEWSVVPEANAKIVDNQQIGESRAIITAKKAGSLAIRYKVTSNDNSRDYVAGEYNIKVIASTNEVRGTGLLPSKYLDSIILDEYEGKNIEYSISEADSDFVTINEKTGEIFVISGANIPKDGALISVIVSEIDDLYGKIGIFEAKIMVYPNNEIIEDYTINSVIVQLANSSDSTEVLCGKSVQLKAIVESEPDAEKFKNVIWSVENNASGISVSENGNVTVAPNALEGKVKIIAKSVLDSTKLGYIELTIKKPKVESVVISLLSQSSSTDILSGGSLQLVATVVSDPDVDEYKVVTWHSNNSQVTVSDSGLVHVPAGTPSGRVTITAKSVTDVTKSGSLELNIIKASVKSVTVSPSESISSNILYRGGSLQLKAIVESEPDTDEYKSVVWSSDVTGVTVNNGLVSVANNAKRGNVRITAVSSRDNSKSGYYDLKVVGVDSVRITNNSGVSEVLKGQSKNIALVANVDVNSTTDSDKAVNWTTNNANITVNNGNVNVSSSANAGEYTITATSVIEASKKATFNLAVVEIKSVEITYNNSSDSVSIGKGDSLQLAVKVTAIPNKSANKNVKWVADKEGVTISSNGLVSVGKNASAGDVVIKAISTKDETVFGTFTIKVYDTAAYVENAVVFYADEEFYLSQKNIRDNLWNGEMYYCKTNSNTSSDWQKWNKKTSDKIKAERDDANPFPDKYYIYLRGTGNTFVSSKANAATFNITDKDGNTNTNMNIDPSHPDYMKPVVNVTFDGNVMNLLDYNADESQKLVITSNDAFRSLFNGLVCLTELGRNFSLPATTLQQGCYERMFFGCTHLARLSVGFELPATELPRNCYNSMFYDCKNLSYIPASFVISPTSIGYESFSSIFKNCSKLSFNKNGVGQVIFAFANNIFEGAGNYSFDVFSNSEDVSIDFKSDSAGETWYVSF